MTDSQKWLTLVLTLMAGFLIYMLKPILMPFLLGFLFAYLGSPLVELLHAHRVPRGLAVCIVFFGILFLFVGLILVLIPSLKDQFQYLQTKMPDFIRWINTQALPWVELNFGLDLKHLKLTEFTQMIGDSWRDAGSVAGQVLSRLATSGLSILEFLINVALIPVVTFYLMLDWPELVAHLRGLIPGRFEGQATDLLQECDEVLGAFFRGQFLLMLCLASVYCLGLKLVGLEIGIVVGLIAGLGSLIPYVGFTTGIILGTIAAVFQFQEFLPVVWVWTVFGIGQVLESWVLGPYLVGNRVGLHPVAVIFAILAGGELFGFFGMLLAIPAAAVIVVLFRHARRKLIATAVT